MTEEINNVINNDKGFIKSNNFKINKLGKDDCTLEYEIKKDGLNPYGIVHGGVLFGLADTAAGLLAAMNEKTVVTMNSSFNFINPTKEGKLFAISRIIKDGKTVGFYEVKIVDENDKIIANALINMYNKKIS